MCIVMVWNVAFVPFIQIVVFVVDLIHCKLQILQLVGNRTDLKHGNDGPVEPVTTPHEILRRTQYPTLAIESKMFLLWIALNEWHLIAKTRQEVWRAAS